MSTEEKKKVDLGDFSVDTTVEVYSSKETKTPVVNPFIERLEKLAELKNEKASFVFPNEHLKGYRYAVSTLRKKDVYFVIRKDKAQKDTHSRIWWTTVKPVAKSAKKAKLVETEDKGE